MKQRINNKRLRQLKEAYIKAILEAQAKANRQQRIDNWKEYEKRKFLLSD